MWILPLSPGDWNTPTTPIRRRVGGFINWQVHKPDIFEAIFPRVETGPELHVSVDGFACEASW